MLPKPFIAVSCLAAFAATGCIVVENDPPTLYLGTLTTSWTLDGSDHPSVCSYYGVDRVDLAVYDVDGDIIVDAQPRCEDFSVSFDIPDGVYSAEITLLAYGGSALSDTVIVPVDVYVDEITVIQIDFPDASIY